MVLIYIFEESDPKLISSDIYRVDACLRINKSLVKSYLKKVHLITQQQEIGIFFGSLHQMFSPLFGCIIQSSQELRSVL